MHKESGIETEECSEGGRNVAFIENGDWIQVKGVDFGNVGPTSLKPESPVLQTAETLK